MSNPLWPHRLQHARLPCPSPAPRACSDSRPSSQWCHPTISCSVMPFFSCLQSFPASGSFQMSQFFTSGGQRIGVSASVSVLLMNIQGWYIGYFLNIYNFHWIKLFLLKKYWNTVALQYCVIFCCRIKWVSYTHTYIHFFLDFFSI